MTDVQIHRGLAGVVVDVTAVSNVVPETNSLTYRGYAVQDLAAHCSFEEVAYLIWHGELPDAEQLQDFSESERAQREISDSLVSVVDLLPTTCHPMDVLRTAVSVLGAEDPSEADISASASLAKAESMFAKLPTVVAYDYRRRRQLERISPDPTLSYCDNFFYM
ncbi:MAG TPA: citrate/2-methylcitrate synthase, partial [Acidimicrobiales bacterium]|nr:citrate/2-methylcitrate synthase [Acidimicrobiales bacterium]